MKRWTWVVVLLLAALLAGCERRADFGVLGAEPDAPVILAWPTSDLTNEVFDGVWFTADMDLHWTHPDPPDVTYYEVWHAVDEPYFEPETCEECSLVITSTALSEVVAAPGQTFSPTTGSPGADIQSRFDIYRVRAVNAVGVSDSSDQIGVVTYSLRQGHECLPNTPGC